MNEQAFDWLEDVLESVIAQGKAFDLSNWIVIPEDEKHARMSGEELIEHEMSCGTVACAIGHCLKDPRFRDAGLLMSVERSFGFHNRGIEPCYKEFKGFEAVARFFNIPRGSAMALFSPTLYYPGEDTAADVLARVRRFRGNQL